MKSKFLAVIIVLSFGLAAASSASAMPSFSSTKAMKSMSEYVTKLQAKRSTKVSDQTRSKFRLRMGKLKGTALSLTDQRFKTRKSKDWKVIQKNIKRDVAAEEVRLENEIRVVRAEYKEKRVQEKHKFTRDRRQIVEEWSEYIVPARRQMRKAKKARKRALQKKVKNLLKRRQVLITERFDEYKTSINRLAADRVREVDGMKARSANEVIAIRQAWKTEHQNRVNEFSSTRASERAQVTTLYSKGMAIISAMPRQKQK